MWTSDWLQQVELRAVSFYWIYTSRSWWLLKTLYLQVLKCWHLLIFKKEALHSKYLGVTGGSVSESISSEIQRGQIQTTVNVEFEPAEVWFHPQFFFIWMFHMLTWNCVKHLYNNMLEIRGFNLLVLLKRNTFVCCVLAFFNPAALQSVRGPEVGPPVCSRTGGGSEELRSRWGDSLKTNRVLYQPEQEVWTTSAGHISRWTSVVVSDSRWILNSQKWFIQSEQILYIRVLKKTP